MMAKKEAPPAQRKTRRFPPKDQGQESTNRPGRDRGRPRKVGRVEFIEAVAAFCAPPLLPIHHGFAQWSLMRPRSVWGRAR